MIGGPSGSGKSTLIAALLDEGGVRLALSATTRPKRDGEVDGQHYHFVSKEAFAGDRIENFLEWAEVHGNLYGTPRSEIASQGPEDRLVLLDVDVQGLRSLKKLGIPCLSVFISPPSLDILETRLRARGTESEAEIAIRLENARRELETRGEYDHVLINADLHTCIDELRRVLGLTQEAASGEALSQDSITPSSPPLRETKTEKP